MDSLDTGFRQYDGEMESESDMVKFLNTSGITYHLEEIIKGSQGGRLLLISPYLKFNPRIKGLLEEQARWKTDIRIVYGKTDLRAEETKWLDDNDVRTSFQEHLHAKCYMSDRHALVTSMNLYEFSQVNNDEMGILVSAEDDPELYQEIKDEADRILRRSENVRLNVTRIDDITEPVQAVGKTRPSGAGGKTAAPESGFCLRCACEIPFDPGHPYCKSHYGSWARYKNEEYEEKHCHACGEEHSTSMAKPVCLSCYREYRSLLRATG